MSDVINSVDWRPWHYTWLRSPATLVEFFSQASKCEVWVKLPSNDFKMSKKWTRKQNHFFGKICQVSYEPRPYHNNHCNISCPWQLHNGSWYRTSYCWSHRSECMATYEIRGNPDILYSRKFILSRPSRTNTKIWSSNVDSMVDISEGWSYQVNETVKFYKSTVPLKYLFQISDGESLIIT